ncbi:MAG: immune inhibitor A [Anaerolineae bacterium]|nr:immune inhibitor A [Anaerolineae bacterium]
MMLRRWLVTFALCAALLAPHLAVGQEGASTLALLSETTLPTLDAADLAARYQGVTAPPRPPRLPRTALATRESFWVIDFAADSYSRVSAQLAAATPGVYLWVQEGVGVNEAEAAEIARTLDEETFPAVRAAIGDEARPGIDGDAHVHVLHAFGLGQELGYFSGLDTLAAEVYDRSNAREMIVVNADLALNILDPNPDTPADVASLNESVYYAVLARAFTRMVHFNLDPDEETWLDEGFASWGAVRAGYPDPMTAGAFWSAPGAQLTSWQAIVANAHTDAAFLFVTYVAGRLGADFVRDWAAEPGNGMASLDATFRARGEAASALDLFADWAVTNAVNDPAFADGRFAYEGLPFAPGRAQVDAIFDAFPVSVRNAAVSPFGTQYIVVAAPPGSDGVTLDLAFEGAPVVPVLPLEPHSGRYVYWSNRGNALDATLTRAFDLSDVDSATLSFWAWHDIDPYRAYAYVAASDDGGATWKALSATTTTTMNPNRLAVGPGFTGGSGGDAVVYYPYLGVRFGDGLTLVEAPPGSPAAEAGLRPGDMITAIDGLRVDDTQAVTALIDARAVGDVVTVSVTRDGAPLDVDVTLGENPTRFRPAPPQWVEQTVDLSAYAGSEILVRFEYVTTHGPDFPGIAIDDIRIEAIGFADDAEDGAGGWEAAGWVRIDNTLPGRFLVQLVQGNAVTRLLDPNAAMGASSGAWTLTLGSGEAALLAISGATPFTAVAESYTYSLTPAD